MAFRFIAFFQVYVIGLYLPEKKATAPEAIGAAGPKRIAIHMVRDVGADPFGDALVDGMKDNVGEADLKKALLGEMRAEKP